MDAYEKPIFSGLLHTGMPDLEALYRVGKIPMVTRGNVPGGSAEWPDPLALPNAAFYNLLVSTVQAPRGIILFDHEAWPYGTQAERQATAAKYVQVYQEIKSRKPGCRIGWYQDPVRREYYRAVADKASPDYRIWQSWNNDLAQVMAPYTDVYFPSLYYFFTRDVDAHMLPNLTAYLIENINEAKRVRRMYGRAESPIYPYVWWRKHDETRDLDADVWETIVRTVLDEADGMVLWGGSSTAWSETAPWWVTIKARLMDKRRTT